MNDLAADDLARTVLETFPFPIAFVYREAVVEAPDAAARVRGIIQTFTVGIQYAALIAAGEYARAAFVDDGATAALERLRRPLLSHFFGVIQAAVDAFRRRGHVPLVTEWAAFIDRLERERFEETVLVDAAPRAQTLGLARALMELRNTLAHRAFCPDYAALAASYLPGLHRYLDALSWTARYPLRRLVGPDQWACLMGSGPRFAAAPIPDEALEALAEARREGTWSGLLLTDAARPPRVLNLYPLVLMDHCPSCASGPLPGLTDEVFLFNGDEGPFLTYLGIRHGRNTEQPRDAVDTLFARKVVRPAAVKLGQLTMPELAARARRQAGATLAAHVAAGRYLPEVSWPRPEVDAALEAFLRGGQTGCCLLGESGIGKTSLACRGVDRWGGAESGLVVLFYEGRGLLAQGDLEDRIAKDLFLKDASLPELLTTLRRWGRTLVVVVDGIDRDTAPAATLQAVCGFVQRYAQRPGDAEPAGPLKVVITARVRAFDAAVRALGIADAAEERRALFPPWAFFTRADGGLPGAGELGHRIVLDRLGMEEAGRLYEAYRRCEGISRPAAGQDEAPAPSERRRVRRFRPTSPFEQLAPAAQRLLTHPWFLRVTLETFDGRPLPRMLWVGEVLASYCAAKIDGRTPRAQEQFQERTVFVDDLVRMMRANRTTTVYRGSPVLPERLARAIAERQLGLSPYLQLVDEGVLEEVPVVERVGYRDRVLYHIRFASDALRDYLLSGVLLADAGNWDGLTPAALAALLAEGRDFEPVAGAVEFLLAELSQRGDLGRVVAALDAGAEAAGDVVVAVGMRVLITLADLEHPGFAALARALAGRGTVRLGSRVLIDAARALLRRPRFVAALACTEAAEALAVRAGAQEDHDEATRLMLEGVALSGLGRDGDALDRLDRAAIAFRRAGPVERAKVEINRANTLQNLRRHEEAAAVYGRALTILDDPAAAGHERRDELRAIASMNKGVALDRLGQSRRALEPLAIGVDLLRLLVESAGRADLEPLLAKACIYRGNALLATVQRPEAVADYDRALRLLAAPSDDVPAEVAHEQAVALMNRGAALDRMGRSVEALPGHGRAVALLRGLVAGGRAELTNELARALVNRALCQAVLGRRDAARADCDEAIELRETLVQSGRQDVANDLERTRRAREEL